MPDQDSQSIHNNSDRQGKPTSNSRLEGLPNISMAMAPHAEGSACSARLDRYSTPVRVHRSDCRMKEGPRRHTRTEAEASENPRRHRSTRRNHPSQTVYSSTASARESNVHPRPRPRRDFRDGLYFQENARQERLYRYRGASPTFLQGNRIRVRRILIPESCPSSTAECRPLYSWTHPRDDRTGRP